MTRLLLIAPALLLAACATTAPGEEEPMIHGGNGECRNDGLAQFTGRPATQELGAEIMRVSGATRLQWIPEGSAVTMEFNPARVRVSLDRNNRVLSARCG